MGHPGVGSGPFTTAEQVKNYIETQPKSEEKNKWMYRKVRFQRNTTHTMKKEDPIFRLKRDGKKLMTEEYADNLCLYLDTSRNVSHLTMSDLRNVLTGLSGVTESECQSNRTEN